MARDDRWQQATRQVNSLLAAVDALPPEAKAAVLRMIRDWKGILNLIEEHLKSG